MATSYGDIKTALADLRVIGTYSAFYGLLFAWTGGSAFQRPMESVGLMFSVISIMMILVGLSITIAAIGLLTISKWGYWLARQAYIASIVMSFVWMWPALSQEGKLALDVFLQAMFVCFSVWVLKVLNRPAIAELCAADAERPSDD